jgi:3-oxoacyl-[acyl-carrier-protein] synthase-3
VNSCSPEKGCQRQTFSVKNPEELNKLLTEGYFKNYLTAIRKALQQSGHTVEDMDFLFTNQVKASTMTAILKELGVPQEKTCRSIAEYGHMGTVDTLFALSQFLEEGKITAGDLVVLASSATGFSWAATVVQY